ncbi:winged helix-turn-helix transcriptional regulator [soil metagenome]
MTKSIPPAERWYEDACGTAHALELVGERWALLVMRELVFGPRRFGDIRSSLPGISANALTKRLESLEASGIVLRRKLPPPASVQVYELTPWGYEAEPILSVLGRWAARSPSHDPTLPLSPASIAMSFRTMFDPKRAKGSAMKVGLRFGVDEFRAEVAGGALTIQRAPLDDVDVTLSCAPTALAAIVYGGRSLAAAEADGSIVVVGDRARLKRFVSLFRLPPKAA